VSSMARKTTFELESNVDDVIKKLGEEAEKKVEESVHAVRNEIQETLSGPRSGKRYRVPDTHRKPAAVKTMIDGEIVTKTISAKPGTYYVASAEGEPPASRLGFLRSTIGWKVERTGNIFGGNKIVGRVGSPMPYAPHLEFGTKNMEPREFFQPSFERAEPRIRKILGREKWDL